jgi:hypothetical protein
MDHLSLAAVPSIGFGAIGAALVILAMTPLRQFPALIGIAGAIPDLQARTAST